MHETQDLRQQFLREQQRSLDELAQLEDPRAALQDLIAHLNRRYAKARSRGTSPCPEPDHAVPRHSAQHLEPSV